MSFLHSCEIFEVTFLGVTPVARFPRAVFLSRGKSSLEEVRTDYWCSHQVCSGTESLIIWWSFLFFVCALFSFRWCQFVIFDDVINVVFYFFYWHNRWSPYIMDNFNERYFILFFSKIGSSPGKLDSNCWGESLKLALFRIGLWFIKQFEGSSHLHFLVSSLLGWPYSYRVGSIFTGFAWFSTEKIFIDWKLRMRYHEWFINYHFKKFCFLSLFTSYLYSFSLRCFVIFNFFTKKIRKFLLNLGKFSSS